MARAPFCPTQAGSEHGHDLVQRLQPGPKNRGRQSLVDALKTRTDSGITRPCTGCGGTVTLYAPTTCQDPSDFQQLL
eukprot:14818229-Alexandrium_andersonii.AAC.1